MKQLSLLFFVVVMAACSKSSIQDNATAPVNPVDSLKNLTRYLGEFKNGPWGTVKGKARYYTYNGTNYIRLEGFEARSGPDLKVYLSKEEQPVNFISLGKLQALRGDQDYPVPGNPDLMEYKYVLVHCEQFNHLFGYALMIMQ
jgi:Electron transfer DM13